MTFSNIHLIFIDKHAGIFLKRSLKTEETKLLLNSSDPLMEDVNFQSSEIT